MDGVNLEGAIASPGGLDSVDPGEQRALWFAWELANSVGEMLGLGLTAMFALAVLPALESRADALAAGLVLAVMVLGGTLVEGITVGTMQWLVLLRYVQALGWRAWAAATALGAGIAWTFGMMPSLLINFGDTAGADAGNTVAVEPNGFVMLALLAAVGAVVGAVHGLALVWLLSGRQYRYRCWEGP